MPAGLGRSFAEEYEIAMKDLRDTLIQVLQEERQREQPYYDWTKDSFLGIPARANRDFGYFGDKHGLTPRQLMNAHRFDTVLQVALGAIESNLKDPDFRREHPALVDLAERTLADVLRAIQPGAVGLKILGSTERGYMPLPVQPDIYASMMRLEQRTAEQKRLAGEAAAPEPSMLRRVMAKLGRLGAGSKQAPRGSEALEAIAHATAR